MRSVPDGAIRLLGLFLACKSTAEQVLASVGFVAGDFNYLSTPADINGPFFAAAKVQSTGDGEQSAWIAAVPVPAAVWLFGSALAGLGWMRRRQS